MKYTHSFIASLMVLIQLLSIILLLSCSKRIDSEIKPIKNDIVNSDSCITILVTDTLFTQP